MVFCGVLVMFECLEGLLCGVYGLGSISIGGFVCVVYVFVVECLFVGLNCLVFVSDACWVLLFLFQSWTYVWFEDILWRMFFCSGVFDDFVSFYDVRF